MRFRQRVDEGFRRAKLSLEPGSAYLLSGASRWDWEHSIAPGKDLRFSITLRTLSEKGARIAAQHHAEPDAGARADLDVPDEHGGRGDEGVPVHPRPPAVELVFRHWPIILASC